MKNSDRLYCAEIYCRNIRPIYDAFRIQANCIAKRIRKNQPVCANHLADSLMLKSLARMLNRYCKQNGEPNCIEKGDMVSLARLVIDEANEILWEMRQAN